MRTSIICSPKGLQARAIAGTYVVLLAIDCEAEYISGLLGFAIQRHDEENDETIWLRGLKRFAPTNSASVEGEDVSTRHHPIQKFHWGDYTTKPGRTYTYTVHALKGSPVTLDDYDSLILRVTCEKPESIGANGHAVHFNRSAASSQAFARRFPSIPSGEVLDPQARSWLSRGLAESLISFVDSVQSGEGLHLFLYEFEKDEFFLALKNASERGVTLEILYDAILKNGEGPSNKSKPLIDKFGLAPHSRGRDGPGIGISHNKFMVITDASGIPRAVWTGSTNFTDAAIYGQSNVGHAVQDPSLAKTYFAWHQAIWNAPNVSAAESRTQALNLTRLNPLPVSGTTLVLSPRNSIEAIEACARFVSGASHMVCFTAPFALHDDLENALVNTPAQVFGLLNRNNVVDLPLRQAPNTKLAAAEAINNKSILEQWQGQLQKESMHHSGVYIHTKVILIDPLSDRPVVITGSANFSENSSIHNDENQLFIIGEAEVADVYLGEFMRMFDHYRFRNSQDKPVKADSESIGSAFLDDTDAWAKKYFAGGDLEKERISFFSR
jgi:phosphatidylserine/phosphatidylglycerophosphate/cardiolipin synthase-like enzyme